MLLLPEELKRAPCVIDEEELIFVYLGAAELEMLLLRVDAIEARHMHPTPAATLDRASHLRGRVGGQEAFVARVGLYELIDEVGLLALPNFLATLLAYARESREEVVDATSATWRLNAVQSLHQGLFAHGPVRRLHCVIRVAIRAFGERSKAQLAAALRVCLSDGALWRQTLTSSGDYHLFLSLLNGGERFLLFFMLFLDEVSKGKHLLSLGSLGQF